MASREKPQHGQIRVSLDSGANIHSSNDEFVEPIDLGFDSMQDWLDATDDEKFTSVQEYFQGNGYPEYSWDDGSR